MMSAENVMDLLGIFIKLRQGGTNRDEAWYAVLAKADHLAEKQVKQLLGLVKDWEKREGFKYHYHSNIDFEPTVMERPDKITDSVIRPLAPRPHPQPPVDGETGALRTQTAAELAAYFAPDAMLCIYFQDFSDVLKIEIPTNKEVVVGRTTTNSAMAPDIDLAGLGQENYGISRMHAAFSRQDDTLLIADLGSRNHTFLNGEVLYPHEVRLLRDGDQITFASLVTQIRFC